MQDPAGMGFGLTGVAPEASLYMYKVFGCSAVCASSWYSVCGGDGPRASHLAANLACAQGRD